MREGLEGGFGKPQSEVGRGPKSGADAGQGAVRVLREFSSKVLVSRMLAVCRRALEMKGRGA